MGMITWVVLIVLRWIGTLFVAVFLVGIIIGNLMALFAGDELLASDCKDGQQSWVVGLSYLKCPSQSDIVRGEADVPTPSVEPIKVVPTTQSFDASDGLYVLANNLITPGYIKNVGMTKDTVRACLAEKMPANPSFANLQESVDWWKDLASDNAIAFWLDGGFSEPQEGIVRVWVDICRNWDVRR